ncbi:MAG: DUF3795 domain-containing protein [Theionarchaea archaeon]|nr:DUF3795 domain-containing protein [Theionarchaea archaeon]
MKAIFSKCGFRCSHCPSYKENLQTDEDRQRCSDGWEKYHNFRFSPEKLRRCDGCQVPDDEKPVLYISCSIRRCAIRNGVETCAHCSAYPCEELVKKTPGLDWPENIVARLKTSIPEKDYSVFVEPYEGIKHLDEIRASLTPEDIIEISKFSVRPKIVDFPESFSTEEIPYKSLHELISALESKTNVSFAQREVLKKRREHLIKILWAFGLKGEFKDNSLIIDSTTYTNQKIHSNYETVKTYLTTFKEYGVHCELIPLEKEKQEKKGWLTPTGALRKTGWFMTMSLDDSAGGTPALKALQSYAAHLDTMYGTKALTFFSKADMRTLKEVT